MTRIAYFDCFSGVSGDMTLGALLDAGFPLAKLKKALSTLDLHGYQLTAEKVVRSSISATKFNVVLDESVQQPHRTLSDILHIINKSKLPAKVKNESSFIFQKLGEVEAKVHGIPLSDVHFHEVGAVDSIIDIVGSVYAFHELKIEKFYCSPLPVGGGIIKAAHGRIPAPAPATMELLAMAKAPLLDAEKSGAPSGELITPTGAALVTSLTAFGRPSTSADSAPFTQPSSASARSTRSARKSGKNATQPSMSADSPPFTRPAASIENASSPFSQPASIRKTSKSSVPFSQPSMSGDSAPFSRPPMSAETDSLSPLSHHTPGDSTPFSQPSTSAETSPFSRSSASIENASSPFSQPASIRKTSKSSVPFSQPPIPVEKDSANPFSRPSMSSDSSPFSRPPMTVEKVGYGAGSKDYANWPNILRIWLGFELLSTFTLPLLRNSENLVLLETNIDDMNPQIYGFLMEKLFAAQAVDVWFTPIQMKKDRPAVMLSVLAPASSEAKIAEIILRETSTLGMRVRPVSRHTAQREILEFKSSLGPAHAKVKRFEGKVLSVSPEYEDCRRIALEKDLPFQDVYRLIESEARKKLDL